MSSMFRMALLSCVAGACGSGEITGQHAGYVDDGTGVPGFREFQEATYLEPMEGGVYIVNGDQAIPNLKQLREYYDRLYSSSLIVNRWGGADSKWDQATQRNISYCISNSFGNRKAEVVSAMSTATEGGWHQAADVRFVYDSSQDASCNASNGNVVFDIRPTSGAPYLARAFVPGQSRQTRNVIIDSSAFASYPGLSAVLAHELGHALGFRHEHTRPESGTCFEDNDWRPLTPYDAASIMHYPQCKGASNSLSFSQRDFDGVALLYGAPGGGVPQEVPEVPSGGQAQSSSASGTVAAGEEVQYQALDVAPGTPFEVRMSGSGDADLYLRFGSQPTSSEYHCRPYLNGSNETCALDVPPGETRAFISVGGYSAASYSIDVDWIGP